MKAANTARAERPASAERACPECRQSSRLTRIEGDASKQAARYHERDEAIRAALLELGAEISSIGCNVSEQLKALRATVGEMAKMVATKGGNGKCRP